MSPPRVSQPLAPAPFTAGPHALTGFMVLAAVLSALPAGSARARVRAAR